MNKIVIPLFVFLILILAACGPAASPPEVVEPTQTPEVVVEPTAEPTGAPTNTPEPTAIPPTPTEEPAADPTATVSSAPAEGLPDIGDLLWSPDLGISTVENIGQFAQELLMTAWLFEFHEDGPFTVFAPAYKFEDIPASLMASAEQWKEALSSHIVPGVYLEADLIALDGQSITTLVEGKTIDITVKDGIVYLNDIAMIIQADILARNGVIHVIDKFLLPPIE
jgi:uncharacterized surface protein with fasciclin (FAS1) repeats